MRLALLSLASIALLMGGGLGLMKFLAPPKPEPIESKPQSALQVVRVREISRGSWQEWVEGYGSARAINRFLLSAEIEGEVLEVPEAVLEGAWVAKGDLLVRLDDREARELEKVAQADLGRSQSTLEFNEKEIKNLRNQEKASQSEMEASDRELLRRETLHKDGRIPQSRLDEQIIACSQRRRLYLDTQRQRESRIIQCIPLSAAVSVDVARLEHSRIILERTLVRSPLEGRITRKFVYPGDRVIRGAPLMEVVDPRRLELAVKLPASALGRVKEGAHARLTTTMGALIEGQVSRVLPDVDPSERTFTVFVDIHQAVGAHDLGPGSFLRAGIQGACHEGVFAVPFDSWTGSAVVVAVPEGEGHILRRLPFELVIASGDTMVVKGNFPQSLLVVVSPVEGMEDGDSVTPSP